MKTIRHTARTAGLIAVAAAATFSLTACQDDGGKDNDAGSSPSAGASKNPEAKNSGSTGNGGNDGNRAGGGTSPQTEATTAGANTSTCTVGKVSIRLQHTGGSAPVILLKATNNGSTRCDLYGHPFVGYPNAQAPIQTGGGKPQSVISLQPGRSAYAALSLEKGNGGNMHREKQLTVQLADRSLHATGATAKVNAPTGAGLALSDNSTVTYWKNTLEEAMQ
ncbi:DUF4232 domain-containing protein [Streptomyces sp. CA-250714]|uniref:DUF4232 domain-containing protein n=1 Tax=Streptomyces sp. CA-250714 TaxID=3240060 RepID=UPI003D938881